MKQRNIYGLALIDTGNLVHSAIVSWDLWESIRGKINSPMDHRERTTNEKSEGLQVVGVGAPWSVYLEGMEECYVLESLVIRGLSHRVILGMFFLQEYNLKIICMEEEVALMPVNDGSTSRARLVDTGCHIFFQ